MSPDEVKRRIEAGVPGARAEVQDLTGTGDHFSAVVISPAFKNKSTLEQHRLVYAALGELLRGPVHAIQLDTRAE